MLGGPAHRPTRARKKRNGKRRIQYHGKPQPLTDAEERVIRIYDTWDFGDILEESAGVMGIAVGVSISTVVQDLTTHMDPNGPAWRRTLAHLGVILLLLWLWTWVRKRRAVRIAREYDEYVRDHPEEIQRGRAILDETMDDAEGVMRTTGGKARNHTTFHLPV